MSQHPHAPLIASLERKIAEKEAQLAAVLARGITEEHRLAQGLHVWLVKLRAQVAHVRERSPHDR